MTSRSILLFSAASPVALQTEAADLLEVARSRRINRMESEREEVDWIRDLAAKLSLRKPKPYRAAIIAESIDELAARLESVRDATVPATAAIPRDGLSLAHVDQPARPMFLYPGQGSQTLGENAALAHAYPRFASTVRRLEQRFTHPPLADYLSGAWGSVNDEVLSKSVHDTDIAQPMLCVSAIATTRALGEMGVRPTITLGHSVGEVGALHGAGRIDADSALELIAHRVDCMRDVVSHTGMLAVRVSIDEIQSILETEPEVWLACDNGPRQIVLAGVWSALNKLGGKLEAAGIRFATLPAAAAFHTPHFAAADSEFQHHLKSHDWARDAEDSQAICISSVSGDSVPTEAAAKEQLASQLSAPVRFREAAKTAQGHAPNVLIQLMGGDSLIRMYRQTNPQFAGREVSFGGSDDVDALASSLGELFLSIEDFRPHILLNNIGLASRPLQRARTSKNSVAHGESEPPVNELVSDSMMDVRNDIALGRPDEPLTVAPMDRSGLAQQVLATIADIGGYSVAEIDIGTSLGSDLGFDSLMIINVYEALSRRYPMWKPTAKRLAAMHTAGDVVASLARSIEDAPSAIKDLAIPQPRRSPERAPQSGDGFISTVVPETRRVAELPEVKATVQRIESAIDEQRTIPYFVEHESAAGATTTIRGEGYVSFSSYNYLGLAAHPQVVNAAQTAVARYGTSASAARILSGNRPIHRELEESLARLLRTDDAVVLVGGYGTNTSIIPHLYGTDDIVFHDAFVHDSIHQGIKASGAVRHSFPHNQIDRLDSALRLRRNQFRRALIVTEGVFSMDGDLADLPAIVEVARRHGAHVMVDEAHSIGVLGKSGGGICEELGVDPADIDILMGTLSKSMASCGGYIAGRSPFIQNLRYTLPGFIFSAAATPANTAAALAALQVLDAEPQRLSRLRSNSRYFLDGARARGVDVGHAGGTPVIPVILGDSNATIAAANRLYREKISVNPIIYPAVPDHLARLRFFLTSEHSSEQLDRALDLTREIVGPRVAVSHVQSSGT